MIRTEKEYKAMQQRLQEEKSRLDSYEASLKEKKYSGIEIERLMEPLLSFHEQLLEEIRTYEQMKQGEVSLFTNLHGIGRLLIAVRIARNLTQKEFGDLLGVDPARVCRYEKNEYQSVSIERLAQMLDTLNVSVVSELTSPIVLHKSGESSLAETSKQVA